MRCAHCQYLVQDKSHFKRKQFDDLSLVETIIKKTGIRSCTISAEGEPLLHPRFADIVAILRKHDVDIMGVTNGVLLDQHINLIHKDFKKITISLDAHNADLFKQVRNADEHTFTKIINNITAYQELRRKKGTGARVCIKFDLHKNIIGYMEAMIEKATALGADEIAFGTINDEMTGAFTPLYRHDRHVVEHINSMRAKYPQKNIAWPRLIDCKRIGFCSMLFNGIVINSDYALSPCCHIPGDIDRYGTFDSPKEALEQFRDRFMKARRVDELDHHCQHCHRRIVM